MDSLWSLLAGDLRSFARRSGDLAAAGASSGGRAASFGPLIAPISSRSRCTSSSTASIALARCSLSRSAECSAASAACCARSAESAAPAPWPRASAAVSRAFSSTRSLQRALSAPTALRISSAASEEMEGGGVRRAAASWSSRELESSLAAWSAFSCSSRRSLRLLMSAWYSRFCSLCRASSFTCVWYFCRRDIAWLNLPFDRCTSSASCRFCSLMRSRRGANLRRSSRTAASLAAAASRRNPSLSAVTPASLRISRATFALSAAQRSRICALPRPFAPEDMLDARDDRSAEGSACPTAASSDCRPLYPLAVLTMSSRSSAPPPPPPPRGLMPARPRRSVAEERSGAPCRPGLAPGFGVGRRPRGDARGPRGDADGRARLGEARPPGGACGCGCGCGGGCGAARRPSARRGDRRFGDLAFFGVARAGEAGAAAGDPCVTWKSAPAPSAAAAPAASSGLQDALGTEMPNSWNCRRASSSRRSTSSTAPEAGSPPGGPADSAPAAPAAPGGPADGAPAAPGGPTSRSTKMSSNEDTLGAVPSPLPAPPPPAPSSGGPGGGAPRALRAAPFLPPPGDAAADGGCPPGAAARGGDRSDACQSAPLLLTLWGSIRAIAAAALAAISAVPPGPGPPAPTAEEGRNPGSAPRAFELPAPGKKTEKKKTKSKPTREGAPPLGESEISAEKKENFLARGSNPRPPADLTARVGKRQALYH